jgi:hypothetical protein
MNGQRISIPFKIIAAITTPTYFCNALNGALASHQVQTLVMNMKHIEEKGCISVRK